MVCAALPARAACKDDGIRADKGHYLMCYELSTDNVRLRKTAKFSSGGQFEVLIPKEKFPVTAPKCRRDLILRMPWTDPGLENAAAKVAQKRVLHDAIVALAPRGGQAGSGQPVDVTIDLAPYVRVVTEDPLKVELTGCNIFFAQKAGAYEAAE